MKDTLFREREDKVQTGENICKPLIQQEPVSRIYKELSKLNSKKTSNPIKKWAKDLNRHLTKEDIQVANKHMKSCSISLPVRQMQMKTTMRYHYTPTRVDKRKNIDNYKCC